MYLYCEQICFVGIEPKFIVCHPARDFPETVTKLFKGDKDMYIWVSFAYKWGWIRQLEGVYQKNANNRSYIE